MKALMTNYARLDLAFERGEGPYLFASDGRQYLDFGSGIAVTALGHAHPRLVKVLSDQANRVWHVSNLYRIPAQERLAERLTAHTFAERAFFCNSGAEAMEAVIKTVRRFHFHHGRTERHDIVVASQAFHGRTLANLAAGASEPHREGFGPMPGGFTRVPFGDLEALAGAMGPSTAAVVLEPIQGEGGVHLPPQGYLRGVREICNRTGSLMALDEVQTGIGRTGRFLATEWEGVSPDVVGLAKGLGGGFPIGAVLATEEAAVGMAPGTHGSTFGGNALASAVADAVVEEVLRPGFLDQVVTTGAAIEARLRDLRSRIPGVISEIRGQGLLVGMVAEAGAASLCAALRERGLLTIPAAGEVVRMLPPLNITSTHVDEAMEITERAFRSLA